MAFELHFRNVEDDDCYPIPPDFPTLKAARKWAKENNVPKYLLWVTQWDEDNRDHYGYPTLVGQISLDQTKGLTDLSEFGRY